MEIIREIIDEIIFDIFMEFYRNLEFVEWSKKSKKKKLFIITSHPEGFYRTKVEYNGQKTWAVFFDMRQSGEALYKLASRFYKEEVNQC